jgi:hypothetical protein
MSIISNAQIGLVGWRATLLVLRLSDQKRNGLA